MKLGGGGCSGDDGGGGNIKTQIQTKAFSPKQWAVNWCERI